MITSENWMDEKLRRIKLIAFDFDGVFTDGKVIVREDGVESVVCSRKDTLRFSELKDAGVRLVVISKEGNPVVAKRCEKMGVGCFQGVDNKLDLLSKLILREGVLWENVAYMGDDINDLPCLKLVGVAITVADGDDKCIEVANIITSRNGGNHAVREVCDLILKAMLSKKGTDK